MDLRTKDEIQLKKKLSKAAKKIRKNRKNSRKINKEIQEFQEIKKLLNSSGSESPVSEGETVAVEPVDSLSSCSIPIAAPEIEIFNEEKVFWLFNQETICLRDFLNESEECNIFGKDAEVPNEDLFRDLIAHHITENVLPDNEKCHSISLYVLYLMSVHIDKNFVSDCSDFLKYRRFELIAAEILPIFVNFGSTSEVLVGEEVDLRLPVKIDGSVDRKAGDNRFPFYNVEMVANVILHYVTIDLIRKEPEVKLLLKAFARLTLDSKIRSSRLFAVYSSLISLLSMKLVDALGLDQVVSCLHLKEEHVLNRVEIARAALMPISSALHEALIIETINFILKSEVLKSSYLKVLHVLKVLDHLKRSKLTPLEIYCILQLINASLPSVTAKAREVGEINSALISLEAGFYNVKDSIDLIRLKLEVAKLRNLVTNSLDKNLSTDYLYRSLVGKRK